MADGSVRKSSRIEEATTTQISGNGFREPIGVIGAGHVGLVTAACLASLGHRVTVRDIDADKIRALKNGRAPIFEPDLDRLLTGHADSLHFTGSMGRLLRSSRSIFVAVDTPPTPSGDADLSRVRAVLDEVSAAGSDGEHILIMKSTVPVGTGDRIRAELVASGLHNIGYVSNPEFLREGSAVTDFLQPDRVVIGDHDPSHGDRVEAIYRHLNAPIMRTSIPSAEMIKYASNAFLATKISFINEIANVCEEVGADVDLVAQGMGLDNRIGMSFLRAGIGYGGSCFPKDVAALKQLAGNGGYHFQLLTAVIEVNELQKRRVVGKLKRHLGELAGKEIAILGLTFKPGTDDMREAASLVLAARLSAEGARVRAYDPVVGEDVATRMPDAILCPSAELALTGADAGILATEWPALVGLDWRAIRPTMRVPLIVDGRNALDPDVMRDAGYVYEGVGRRPTPSSVGLPTG
jgi:UDPglucose 6-dehydrogenase